MIVYGASLSPFVRKVLIAAAEKGIVIDNRPANPRTSDDADFVQASPFRKIPALKDGDYTLCDSTAIIAYMEAKHPQPALIPADARARGKAVWFEELADTILAPANTKIFFNRIIGPRFLNIPCNEAEAMEAQTSMLPPLYAYLEGAIPASGFLVGDSISIADIAVTSMIVNLTHAGAPVDAAAYPKLAAYFARMSARPSISGILAAERQMLGL